MCWLLLYFCVFVSVSVYLFFIFDFFFFKQKTAYEMRISDWSSDVCSSDLFDDHRAGVVIRVQAHGAFGVLAAAAADFGGLDAVIDGVAHQEIGRASCRERVCQYV